MAMEQVEVQGGMPLRPVGPARPGPLIISMHVPSWIFGLWYEAL
jgi:hypothetical protein